MTDYSSTRTIRNTHFAAVWLSEEEEEGYYYGFANEGLWPLCHMAHTRPTFRASDWEDYSKVNARFADALAQEMRRRESPCRSHSGLSFRPAAADDKRAHPACQGCDLLAYSVAKS